MNTKNSRINKESPIVFFLNPAELHKIRERIDQRDSTLLPAYEKLLAEADRALPLGPFSVVDKSRLAPSGDPHDYLSIGPYWWPNPDTPDGLPYIRLDGQRNPEYDSDQYDNTSFFTMFDAVTTLSLAYYFSRSQNYALRAAELVRHWFINSDTAMNPNLNYAQGIPGRRTTRGTGIIEAYPLPFFLDVFGLLADSGAWSAADQQALVGWLENFLTWLQESDNGREEAKSKNNHGTHYDLLVAYLALYLDHPRLAQNVLTKMMKERIPEQIEPDGRQPLELIRTAALHYSIFNLLAWFKSALLGEHCGLNLWTYQTNDGRSIRQAIDWLLPYFYEPQKWPYQQITPLKTERIAFLLRLSAKNYNEPYFEEALRGAIPGWPADRVNLLYLSPFER